MEVWISSGTHVDSIAEREEQIEEQFENLDVIFGEGAEKSTGNEQIKSILAIAPIAPLIAAAVISHIYISIGLRGRIKSRTSNGNTGRDREIIRNIASRHDIDWHEIDNEPLGKYIYANAVIWGILNWGSLLGITVFTWPSPLTVWNTVIYVSMLLLAGFLLFIGLLAIANHAREEAMSEVIINQSEKHDRAVVILGEAHHPGVGKRLRNEPEVGVINPAPENLDWGTRVMLQIFNTYERITR